MNYAIAFQKGISIEKMGFELSKGYGNHASSWQSPNTGAGHWARKKVRHIKSTGYFMEYKGWRSDLYKPFQYLDREGPYGQREVRLVCTPDSSISWVSWLHFRWFQRFFFITFFDHIVISYINKCERLRYKHAHTHYTHMTTITWVNA